MPSPLLGDKESTPEDMLPIGELARPEEASSGLVSQTSLVEAADAFGSVGSLLPLVWRGGEPHAWGGPRICWADRQDLRAMVFVLDN